MINRTVLFVFLAFTILCACGTGKQKTEEHNAGDRPIVVALERNMPGYFIVGGERYGYPYELLNAYAVANGRILSLQTGLSESSLNQSLSDGRVDFIATQSETLGEGALVLPLYSTTYVVMVSGRNAGRYAGSGLSLSEMFAGRMIMATEGFEATKGHDLLLDSLSSSALLYIAPKGGVELAASLAANHFDMLICEKSEALLAEELLHNVKRIYEFPDPVSVNLVFKSWDRRTYEDFSRWIENYRNTNDFAELTHIYLNKGFGSQFPLINKPNRVVGGISVWDDIVRDVGEREGVDWRLLSAIAYNESRFRPDVESHRGAKGMMQIMPVTASYFKMENYDLHDPRTSLTIAAKLIKTIDNMLGFTEYTSENDRLGIILAAYNSGVGNVMDARRLAAAYGEDRDSWTTVSKYLVLMGDDDFAPADISYRTFRGSGETLAFVDNVIRKYDSYRESVQ